MSAHHAQDLRIELIIVSLLLTKADQEIGLIFYTIEIAIEANNFATMPLGKFKVSDFYILPSWYLDLPNFLWHLYLEVQVMEN